MALKFNFYSEIFLQEEKWIELINAGLLNSVYCNLVLKPFYEKKRMEIQLIDNQENKILEQILNSIDEILIKFEEFNTRYRNMELVDIKEILPLFLSNKMSNNALGTEDIVSYKKRA